MKFWFGGLARQLAAHEAAAKSRHDALLAAIGKAGAAHEELDKAVVQRLDALRSVLDTMAANESGDAVKIIAMLSDSAPSQIVAQFLKAQSEAAAARMGEPVQVDTLRARPRPAENPDPAKPRSRTARAVL
jgi:hypothetical protein